MSSAIGRVGIGKRQDPMSSEIGSATASHPRRIFLDRVVVLPAEPAQIAQVVRAAVPAAHDVVHHDSAVLAGRDCAHRPIALEHRLPKLGPVGRLVEPVRRLGGQLGDASVWRAELRAKGAERQATAPAR